VYQYDYDVPDGSMSDTSGFTQVVWKATCKIGCGYSGDYAVCRYSPAGNQFDENGGYSQYFVNVVPPLDP
jgi:hypothetical protein